jgi:hypothetical protein
LGAGFPSLIELLGAGFAGFAFAAAADLAACCLPDLPVVLAIQNSYLSFITK